jgi:hypothetical protein
MVDGFHMIIWNRTMKPVAIALSGLRGAWGVERDGGGDVINVQYKPVWNCHTESPLYNKYILIIKGQYINE